MKIIKPAKYVAFLIIFFLVVFPLLGYLVFSVSAYILTLGATWVPYTLFFFLVPIGFLMMLTIPMRDACLIIKNGTIFNNVDDGTHNYRWRESISDVRSAKLVGKEEVQKHFKQFNKREAILIDFGNYNVKYIWTGLFSKKQIKEIIDRLNNQ